MAKINSEQLGNSEPTNFPVYLINSEQPGVSEHFWDDQKVPYRQVRLYLQKDVCMYLVCTWQTLVSPITSTAFKVYPTLCSTYIPPTTIRTS